MESLLIHACCANCLLYPLKVLEGQFQRIMVFWYNPNIHPYQEYKRRLDAMKQLEERWNLRVIYRDTYPIEEWLQAVVFREEKRCLYCYHERLLATAQVAKRGNFSHFTTTLLYSKQQRHEIIKEIGESIGRRYGVKFFYQDFREGWKEGIRLSKGLGLYRQQYCGCIYSEKERYYSQGKGGEHRQTEKVGLSFTKEEVSGE